MRRPLAFLLALVLPLVAPAHDGLNLEPPQSVAEAWNTVQLCTANLEKLIAGQQWTELPVQLAIITQAALYLRARSEPEPAAKWLEYDSTATLLVRAALTKQSSEIPVLFDRMKKLKLAIEAASDPKLVHAAVYSCPMCRGVRDLNPKVDCFKCGMKLVPRIIPASSLYNTPGEPSILLTPKLDAPLAPARTSHIRLKLTRKKDGAPITPDDLLVVHTERIHLLIVDQSLGDYHHLHPRPTDEPGVYEFTMTPQRPGPYRIFADIVPAGSNVQEYATCDLPNRISEGDPVSKTGIATSSMGNGMHFTIQWNTGGLGLQPHQPVGANVTITDAAGKPFRGLEPVMGTYAHLVAFHEDHQTVLHIHPSGGVDPQSPEDRGGPRFFFRFWAPKPGFYRLYAQVQIGGKQVFAPFALNVE